MVASVAHPYGAWGLLLGAQDLWLWLSVSPDGSIGCSPLWSMGSVAGSTGPVVVAGCIPRW